MLVEDMIEHVGHRSDDIHVELTVQTLLNDLHVQQAEESAAEAEAQGYRRLWREGQGGIVQLQLLQGGTQILIIGGIDGIDACEDHRLHLLKTLDGLVARARHMRDGIAHTHLRRSLDARDDVAHIARAHLLSGYHVHLQHTYLIGIILHARVEELHMVALAHHTVYYLVVSDDATE